MTTDILFNVFLLLLVCSKPTAGETRSRLVWVYQMLKTRVTEISAERHTPHADTIKIIEC